MNNEIINFAKKIFPYPRSITGSGVRKTLKEIKRIVPNLKIYKVKSNTKVFDWKVPPEWKVYEAYIVTPDGKKICDFKKNNLHLVGYSIPINKIITKNELEKHLYSLPNQYPPHCLLVFLFHLFLCFLVYFPIHSVYRQLILILQV